MPSGSITLLEAVKFGSDILKKGVVEVMVQESPILGRIPMQTLKGNAIKRKYEEVLPTVSFRDVNEGYTRDFGADSEVFWGTTILGGEVFVDNYILNTMGNEGSVYARAFEQKAKAAALTYDKYFFDGTGAAKDFKGLNALTAEGFGQALSGTAGLGANGLQVTASSANMLLFLDKLDETFDLLRTGTPDVMYMNRTVRRMITKAARESISGTVLIDTGTDKFGRQVTMYNGVPIGIIGDDALGNQILAFDETEGSSTDCASIYLIRWGEDDGVSGLFGAGGHFEVRDFGEQEAAPGHMGRIEFYPGLMVASRYSYVRLTGIRR